MNGALDYDATFNISGRLFVATSGELTIYCGGSVTGAAADGLSTDGGYTPGTEYASFRSPIQQPA